MRGKKGERGERGEEGTYDTMSYELSDPRDDVQYRSRFESILKYVGEMTKSEEDGRVESSGYWVEGDEIRCVTNGDEEGGGEVDCCGDVGE